MSGFEIAGIVLGSLPLVISALEHYESGMDRVTVFFKWKDELDKAKRDLGLQHVYYEMTLREILVDVASAAELEEMMGKPESPLWKSPELRAELREKLGLAYPVYEYTIQQMSCHLKTLASHLDIERPAVRLLDWVPRLLVHHA